MPFSVKDKQHMTQEELTALANCRSSQCIGIKDNLDGRAEIVRVSRADITCWQIFLRALDVGKLADIRYSLNDVLDHLKEFDWAALSNYDKESLYYKAYFKACQIATKAIVYKGDDALLKNVAEVKLEKQIKYSLFHGNKFLNRMNVVKTIHWNPAMDYKTLHTLMKRDFSNARVSFRSEDSKYKPTGHLSKSSLQKINILVEQRIPQYRPVPGLAGHVFLGGLRANLT